MNCQVKPGILTPEEGLQRLLSPGIDALIFDCDGTLIDSMPLHYAAWVSVLAPAGIDFPEARFYAFAGMPTRVIVERLCAEQGRQADALALTAQKERIFLDRLTEVQVLEPVVALARRESGRRKLAVASGGRRNVVTLSLQGAGLAGLFPVVVCAEDVVHGKPAPDLFLLAAEKLGVAPDRCLVLEDGEMGFEAALAAGMAVIDVRGWDHSAGT